MRRGGLAVALGTVLTVTGFFSGCTGASNACAGPATFPPSFFVDGTAWAKAHPGDVAVLCVHPSNPHDEWSCQNIDARGPMVQLDPTTNPKTLSHTTPFTITVARQEDGVQGPAASFVEHLTSNGYDPGTAPRNACSTGIQWLEKLTLNPDGTLTDAGYGAL